MTANIEAFVERYEAGRLPRIQGRGGNLAGLRAKLSDRKDSKMWLLFHVPCPTPDGQSAQDLYEKRVVGITPAMKESAKSYGCSFHRAWYAEDGSAFWALANWETAEGANRFFTQWNIADEPGETMIRLEGDVGLAPLG